MNPVASQIGSLAIRWYGVMVALGFLSGFHLLQHRARKGGFGAGPAADLTLLAMLSGIAGGRLLYVLMNLDEFTSPARSTLGNLIETVRIDHGGLVFYGGLLAAFAALFITCRRKSWSCHTVGDLFAPALPLGQAFGRIGCFLNGCCFGRPWPHAFGVRYPAAVSDPSGRLVVSSVMEVQRGKDLLPPGATACLPVFPVQLVFAGMDLTICVALLLIERRRRSRGQLFPLYLLFYTAGRFVLEFARGDYVKTVGPLTPAQVICLALLPLGAVWLVAVRRQDAQRMR